MKLLTLTTLIVLCVFAVEAQRWRGISRGGNRNLWANRAPTSPMRDANTRRGAVFGIAGTRGRGERTGSASIGRTRLNGGVAPSIGNRRRNRGGASSLSNGNRHTGRNVGGSRNSAMFWNPRRPSRSFIHRRRYPVLHPGPPFSPFLNLQPRRSGCGTLRRAMRRLIDSCGVGSDLLVCGRGNTVGCRRGSRCIMGVCCKDVAPPTTIPPQITDMTMTTDSMVNEASTFVP